MPISAADAAGALEVARVHELAAAPLHELMAEAARLRDLGHGRNVSYSRKVFIPLTRLCRDTCRYCTFVKGPRAVPSAYLAPDEVLAIARAGAGGGLQGGAVHARRQAGAEIRLGADGAGRARSRDHTRISRRDVRAGAARDRVAAARQCRRDDGRGHRRPAPRVGVPGADAGERLGAPVRARRTASRLPRQGTGGAARDDRGGRAAAMSRSPPGILIGIGETRQERIDSLARDPGAAPPPRARAGDHHPELPRQAGRPAWRARRSPTSTSCCGRSRWRA